MVTPESVGAQSRFRFGAVAGGLLAAVGTALPWVRYRIDEYAVSPQSVGVDELEGTFTGLSGDGVYVLALSLLVVAYVAYTRADRWSQGAVMFIGAGMLYKTATVLADPATLNSRIGERFVPVTTFTAEVGLVLSLLGGLAVFLSALLALLAERLT